MEVGKTLPSNVSGHAQGTRGFRHRPLCRDQCLYQRVLILPLDPHARAADPALTRSGVQLSPKPYRHQVEPCLEPGGMPY